MSIALIALAAAAVYWPALRGAFVSDDFFLLLIAHQAGDPFSFFLHSHFPGNFYYRPVAMAVWWLSAELFGGAAKPHYALNLCLHVGVALALWRLLLACTRARLPALLCALSFALHPIAIGTSLWLSDRFDLLAALFALLAIHASWNYANGGARASLIATFAFATLAVLSKEIGFAAFVPIALIWAWPLAAPATTFRQRYVANVLDWPHPLEAPPPIFWTRTRRAIGFLVLLAISLLLWRHALIGSIGTQAVLGDIPLWQQVAEGLRKWGVNALVYGSAIAHSGPMSRAAGFAGGILLCGFLLAGLIRARPSRPEAILLLASAGLVLVTAIVQAPMLLPLPSSFELPSTAQTAVMNARLFYLSMAGATLFAGTLCSIAARAFAAKRWIRRSAIAAAMCCLIPWAIAAHALARDYRRESLPAVERARAALAAVARIPGIGEHCQVYFLGMDKALNPAQELAFSMQIDATIKALAPPAQAYLRTCRFQTDRTPWFYIVPRGALTADNIAPMQPLYVGAHMLPWLEYGNVEIAYLNLHAADDPKSMTTAHFLDYANGVFSDVTAEVLSGKREVRFRCARGATQCAVPGKADPAIR